MRVGLKLASVSRVFGFGVCIFLAIPCAAQNYPGREADLEGSRTTSSLIVAEIRPVLFDHLPAAEAAIYRQIRFDVSLEDKVMNAWAYTKDGVRHVTLTEAMGRAIQLNVDAMLIEQLHNKENFLGRYFEYVCQRYAANYPRYAQGLPPLRINSPYEQAGMSNAEFEEFDSDADVRKARGNIVAGAYAFLLGHEVAHHVLGHVGNMAPRKSEARRRQEAAADDWAINLLIKNQISPVTGIVPMLFFYYTDQHPVETEADRDHPADARRLLAMYEGLRSRLPEFRDSIESSGQDYETVRRQVETSIRLVKQEIGISP